MTKIKTPQFLSILLVVGALIAQLSLAQTSSSTSSSTPSDLPPAESSTPSQVSISSDSEVVAEPTSTSTDSIPISTTTSISETESSTSATTATQPALEFEPSQLPGATSTPAVVSSTEPNPVPVITSYPECGKSIKSVPGNYSNIQDAINAASIGDTVQIAEGTYNESIKLKSGICIEGAGVDRTIISKSGASGILGAGVNFVIVKNLTVSNSGSENLDGGGVLLDGSSNVTFESCRITGNTAINGGGVFVTAGNLTMNNCSIDNNTASNVGGGIVGQPTSKLTLSNVTITNNHWSNTLGNGGVGGLSFYGTSLEMTDSTVKDNEGTNFSGNRDNIKNSDIGS